MIIAANKKHLDSLTSDFRKDGYKVITYGANLRELEKGSDFVVIVTYELYKKDSAYMENIDGFLESVTA